MAYYHTPVMLKEAIEFLNLQAGEKYIDCTLGGGGYTEAILEKIGSLGLVISIDLDKNAINNAKKKFKKQIDNKNLILINDNFKNLFKVIKKYCEDRQAVGFFGIVFDLGLSSNQLKDHVRGFSFQLDAPLDMKFGEEEVEPEGTNSAKDIINVYKQKDLEKIIREYGEEKYAARIAKKIVETRKEQEINTTKELVEAIKSAIPASYRFNKINFATKTFQALRIATNRELENLELVLPQAVGLLAPGARIITISYHSLEDRLVKNFFKKESRQCVCPPEAPVCQCGHKPSLKIITRKVIKPAKEELIKNPRARSAKMRVAEKI